uniref:Rab-GAP TBC domain-containing protein n=1 Tax=Globisporangium ultimum (strain ATCC 200006 / CBS 805.95 / DAOM BR144) TaxID=431595 RepID=K3WM79_GLOUD
MADIWRNKMPGLSRCIYLYNQLLQIHFNDLYLHLRQIGMHPSFLATQWFVTLFARVFPLPTVARVWDLFLVDGWKMIFRVALAITAHIRPHIIDLDMEQCSEFFRQNPKLQLEQLHIDELLSSALSFKITRKSLHKMEDERNLEYLRLRLQKTPLSYEHSVLFPNLDNNGAGHNQKVTLNFIRSQLEHFDDDVTSDTIVLRQKIEGIDKLLVQATASLYTLSYALTEVTFELEDHLEAKQRLRAQFQALSAIAIAEATAPSPSSLSGNDDLRRRKSLQLWSPAETLTYINNRMYGCFERATRLSMLSTRNSSKQEEDFDEHEAQEREQERRTLSHLEILVPRLAADLKAIQKKIDANDLELHGVQQRYLRLQSECQLAKVRVEEMQQFKDRLSDQMVQLMLETERLKNSKMQQLFAQVDEVNEAQES